MISVDFKRVGNLLRFRSSPPGEPVRVLLVEGSADVTRTARHLLQAYRDVKFVVTPVTSTERCLHLLSQGTFELILLDYNLPGEDGIGALLRLVRRADPPPVIMLVPEGHDAIGAEAIRSGAHDYFPKGLGHAIHQSLDWHCWEAEAKRLRDELEHVRVTDELTGLYASCFLAESLGIEISRARRHGRDLSFLMLDLDDFRQFNRAHGDEVGDSALKHVSVVIQNCMRSTDLVARYKEDEFCVLLTETPLGGARTAAERLRFAIAAHPVTVGGRSMPITASVGVCAVGPQDGLKVESVISDAEAALKEAKRAGKNQISLHLPSGDPAEADGRAADTGDGAKAAHTDSGVGASSRQGGLSQPYRGDSEGISVISEQPLVKGWDRHRLEMMWNLVGDGARRTLKSMAVHPEGISRLDLVEEIGIDTGMLGGYLANIRFACKKSGADVRPYKTHDDLYTMDPKVAEKIRDCGD
ncbi:MAG: diguanylate cyclase [Nitrospirales bacterium]